MIFFRGEGLTKVCKSNLTVQHHTWLNYFPFSSPSHCLMLHYVTPSPHSVLCMCGWAWNAKDSEKQRGKRMGGQPAHVERHGCALMWLQLRSPGPNEVLWSSVALSPFAYTPAAHILPWLRHSGSLRRCSQIPLGTVKEKEEEEEKKNSPQIGT